MAQQIIGIGTTANDGTGDPLRNGFNKTNDNFTELYGGDGVINQRDSSILKLWTGSQAQYDALTPEADTVYFII
tara:strand:+ start:162 stop:383 length:222 start_codon:yes stop_codon:yes gene_type:complete